MNRDLRLRCDQFLSFRGQSAFRTQAGWNLLPDNISESQPLHHTGQWRIVNHFLDGSEVLLTNAAVTAPATPEDKNPRLAFGDLAMYAHNRSGKVALARNEVAEWYYERFQ
jgi:hypothetical protein